MMNRNRLLLRQEKMKRGKMKPWGRHKMEREEENLIRLQKMLEISERLPVEIETISLLGSTLSGWEYGFGR